ncbi:MAG: hypothetical protein H6835_04850 [Planctomycetes bacterium]|nr:hypothetical protein [Planctomycetota bacterium]
MADRHDDDLQWREARDLMRRAWHATTPTVPSPYDDGADDRETLLVLAQLRTAWLAQRPERAPLPTTRRAAAWMPMAAALVTLAATLTVGAMLAVDTMLQTPRVVSSDRPRDDDRPANENATPRATVVHADEHRTEILCGRVRFTFVPMHATTPPVSSFPVGALPRRER